MILFLIIFFATLTGAVSGIGGGIIIKPVLDALTNLSPSHIGFLSSISVFFMALSAVFKYFIHKFPMHKNMLLLGFGAALGGTLGTKIFNKLVYGIENDELVKAIQNAILFLLLIIILIYMKKENRKQFCIKQKAAIFCIGGFSGILSSFLGIGGGPINVAILSFFFSMSFKNAAVNSIVLILFSQTAKLITLAVDDAIPDQIRAGVLFTVISAALLGGLCGSTILKSLSPQKTRFAYYCVMLFIILICLFNIISSF